MPRQLQFLLLLVVIPGLCGLLTGCDPLQRQRVRAESDVPPYLLEETEDPSFEHPEELRGFFKPTRTSGAWSREAREIERNLGAIP